MNEEIPGSADPLRPRRRGVVHGPWDVSESGGQGTDLIDLGGLRVPRTTSTRLELNSLTSHHDVLAEAVLIRDASAALQLQAYRATGDQDGWDAVRGTLAADIRARGGDAEQWSGRAGVELRAVIPVINDARGRDRQTVRFLGCDGPGWLLRGVVSGEAAAADSRDEWAYCCFERVVVVPSFTLPVPAVFGPSVHGGLVVPPRLGPVIPLSMPDRPGRSGA